MEKKTIGQFIAILREANGLTQQELADKLNESNKAVSRWERDESAPDITLIPALAEILGVTCDELLKGERITYAQQPEKKEAKVEKQVKVLIQREISKYRTLMLIAVTKMRDAKADSEVFECADETLIHKYNKCLGDFSFWVLLCVGIYLFIKKPYVRWITGETKSYEEDKDVRSIDVEIRLKKMNRIQIGAILLSGVVYIIAPYFERSPEDALIWWIVFVCAIGLILVNVITAVVFIAKEKGNRKYFTLFGI